MQRVCRLQKTLGSDEVFYALDLSEEVVGVPDERISLRLQKSEIVLSIIQF
jgi:hypothetical protein